MKRVCLLIQVFILLTKEILRKVETFSGKIKNSKKVEFSTFWVVLRYCSTYKSRKLQSFHFVGVLPQTITKVVENWKFIAIFGKI